MFSKRDLNQHFDERQIQLRNKVGTQSFFMLYFLLLVDLLFEGSGIKWATGPMVILIIMAVSMTYYLVRIVWAGAYAGQSTERKQVFIVTGFLTVTTIVLAIVLKTNFLKEGFNTFNGGFLRLAIFFVAFFGIIIVSNTVSRRKSDKGE